MNARSSVATTRTIGALLLGWMLFGDPAAQAADSLQVVAEHGTVTVRRADREVLVYQSAPNPYKVYVRSLTTPAGIQILRDSPHDHIHHRSLMFAVGVDNVDFWTEAPATRPGKQVPVGQTGSHAQTVDGRWQAAIEQEIEWQDADGRVLMRESRCLRLDGGTLPDATLLVWDSRFRTPPEKPRVELWGRHYFGLGLRMVSSMDKGGKVLTATEDAGESVRGTERLLAGAWCGYTATVDGDPVTVAMFNHPENGPPATWFTMTGPFAYVSATLGLKDEKLALTADAPLRLRYAVVLWDGEKSPEQIAHAYSRWKAEPKASRPTAGRPAHSPHAGNRR